MKTTKYQSLGRLAIVLAILIVVNFISIRLFFRLDLTKNGVYTLSDASKSLVQSLDDRLTVKAYFTEDLPAPYNNNRRTVLDLLNEYRAYAGGNLHFEFINPEGEKGEKDAQEEGIPPVQVQVVKDDKLEVKRAYLGLVMMFEDKKEVLPVIQNLSSLEYDFSSAVKRLTTKQKPKVGYSTGHQEPELSSFRRAYQSLAQQYELVPVDLTKHEPVAPDITSLLVIAPQTQFNDSAKYLIDQFIMRGGKAAFLLNTMNVNLNSQYRFAQPQQTGLEDLLAQYGIRLNSDMVRDAQCANISIVQQQGPFQFQSQVPFPYLPSVSNFNKSNIVVKDLENVVLYFAGSLDTATAKNKGLNAEVLMRSSKQSGRQSGFMMVDPMQQYSPNDFSESGIPLAAVVSGSFSSYFTGKPLAPVHAQSPETRILVVGDGDFMKDDFAGNKSNMIFFQNIVDYLSDESGLITIRSKDVTEPPLDPVSDGMKKFLKYGNLAAPPLLVILYGLLRWRRRVSFKKSMESQIA
ncbi:MAG: Gldg family protein [Bacteroidota bacterium]